MEIRLTKKELDLLRLGLSCISIVSTNWTAAEKLSAKLLKAKQSGVTNKRRASESEAKL